MLTHKYQVSESLTLGIMLALSGGFMDAYSYIGRGHVFANAQTGNMILLGIRLSEGNISFALHYLFPVLAYTGGILLAEVIRSSVYKHVHWRQTTVLLEALILAYVAWLPQAQNMLANCLASFVCGMQVEAFRKIHGNHMATTMCMGNLRSASENFVLCFRNHDKHALVKTGLYLAIIGSFIGGAIIGYWCVHVYKELSILACSILLFIGFCYMFVQREIDQ